MEYDLINPDMFIADIMERWPETIILFLEHGMACAGCSLSAFSTLADALEVYNIPQEEILVRLNQPIMLQKNNPGRSIG